MSILEGWNSWKMMMTITVQGSKVSRARALEVRGRREQLLPARFGTTLCYLQGPCFLYLHQLVSRFLPLKPHLPFMVTAFHGHLHWLSSSETTGPYCTGTQTRMFPWEHGLSGWKSNTSTSGPCAAAHLQVLLESELPFLQKNKSAELFCVSGKIASSRQRPGTFAWHHTINRAVASATPWRGWSRSTALAGKETALSGMLIYNFQAYRENRHRIFKYFFFSVLLTDQSKEMNTLLSRSMVFSAENKYKSWEPFSIIWSELYQSPYLSPMT